MDCWNTPIISFVKEVMGDSYRMTRKVEGSLAAVVELFAVFFGMYTALQSPTSLIAVPLLGLIFFITHLISRWMLRTPLVDFWGFSSNHSGYFFRVVIICSLLGLAYGPLGAVAAAIIVTWAYHLLMMVFSTLFALPKDTVPAKPDTKSTGYYLDIIFTMLLRLGMSFGLAAAVLGLTGYVHVEQTVSEISLFFGIAATALIIQTILNAHYYFNAQIISERTRDFWKAAYMLMLLSLLCATALNPKDQLGAVVNAMKFAGTLAVGGLEIYLAKLLFFGFYKKEDGSKSSANTRAIAAHILSLKKPK